LIRGAGQNPLISAVFAEPEFTRAFNFDGLVINNPGKTPEFRDFALFAVENNDATVDCSLRSGYMPGIKMEGNSHE
jgi:hypothetical protein